MSCLKGLDESDERDGIALLSHTSPELIMVIG